MLGINTINDLHISVQESAVTAKGPPFVQNAWDHKVLRIEYSRCWNICIYIMKCLGHETQV